MLVLSRKPGQEVTIGGNVTIRVLENSRGGRVRLGIEAPRDVPIARGEIAPDSTGNGTDGREAA